MAKKTTSPNYQTIKESKASRCPLISLIIPVYNVEPYLRRCLDSVLIQTYQNLEVILVDDGSTDQSGNICDHYAAKDQRLTVIHQKNGGLSHARNVGLAHSHGKYLAFLDSDDEVAPTYIDYLYRLIEKYQTKLSICSLMLFYGDKQPNTVKEDRQLKTINQGNGFRETKLTQSHCLERMLLEQGFTVVAYAKLYHRSLLKNLSFPEGKLHEDLGFTYKPIMRCDHIAYGPKPQYNYYIRSGSIATSKYTDKKLDIINLTDQMCDTIDTIHPDLKSVTDLRRLHARFSVLRQMPNLSQLTRDQRRCQQEIISYIKEHKKTITNNPHATRRDKIAFLTLRLGLPIFHLSWKVYDRLVH